MSLRNKIDFEVKSSGLQLSGAGFNANNPNAGLNYSYGNDYQIISYDDIQYNYYDAPASPSYTLVSSSGTLASGSYYLGIRYISFDLDNAIEATSQLTEILISVSDNDRIDISAPFDAIHPFTHYQITLRQALSSTAYFQKNNGTMDFYTPITESFFVETFWNLGANLTTLPDYGNIYKLSSVNRPFINDDIGNYILFENNHVGFRAYPATSPSFLNSPAIEICKTTNDPIAAWFDITDTSKVVRRISAVAWAVGSPTGNLFFELRSDNSGVPSDVVLSFGSIDVTSLTPTASWVDISVNVSCAPGRYWIVIYLDNTPDISNYVRVKRAAGNFGINNQHFYTYNSGTSTWTSVNDNLAVAIDASWNTESWWTWGNFSSYLENLGNQRYEILNVNSGEALIYEPSADLALPGSTGGLCHLGGAESSLLRMVETSNLQCATQGINNIYIQNATYTIDKPIQIYNSLHLHGYENIHEDYSENRPVILVDPLADPSPFAYGSFGAIWISSDHMELINLEIDGSDIAEILVFINDNNVYINSCYLHNSQNNGIYVAGNTNCVVVIDSVRISNISNTNADAAGIFLFSGYSLDISHSYFSDIIGSGIFSQDVSFSSQFCLFENINGTLSYLGIGIRVENASSAHVHYNTFHNIQRTGVNIFGDGHFFITNNIFSTCNDSAVFIDPSTPTSFGLQRIDSNAFYNNIPTNVTNNITVGSGTRPYIISGNPFANTSIGDFRLNSNTGAGYNLIGNANPQKFISTSLPQKMDVGAVQTYGNSPVPRRNPTITFF